MKTRGLARLLSAVVFWLLAAPAAHAQVGALQTDCGLGGVQRDGAYQFVATCAGRAASPDGRFAVVQKAYEDEQPPIELRDGQGRVLAALPSLSDDMPFSVSWAPGSRWFFVNHHVGSFMDVLQIFEIVGETAVERPALVQSAVKIATARYPCLPADQVLPNGVRWTRDGQGIVLVTISRPDACDLAGRLGQWRSLWMIGEVGNGRVSPASIRAQADDTLLRAPSDGPYAKR
jgi:hypothetical protein